MDEKVENEKSPDAILTEFLQTVITPATDPLNPPAPDAPPPTFYVKVVFGSPIETGTKRDMWPQFYRWPDELPRLLQQVREKQDDFDCYFTSFTYSSHAGTKDYAWHTRTLQADLDEADVARLPFPPTALVETSAGHHHAYWVLDELTSLSAFEALNRKVSHGIPLCDVTGWTIGHLLRLPTTPSHKHEKFPVRLLLCDPSITVTLGDLSHLPEPTRRTQLLEERLNRPLHLPAIGPEKLMDSYGRRFTKAGQIAYREPAADRSKALYALHCAGFRAGMSPEEVFLLAWNSVNNKYKDRLNGRRDLLREILKAEEEVTAESGSIKEKVLAARDSKLPTVKRYRAVFDLVGEEMRRTGEFIHTFDDGYWFLPTNTGRPISISRNSEQLSSYLNLTFGLNPVEKEQQFVVMQLRDIVAGIPGTAAISTLSFYDENTKSLLLHSGARDVLRITPTNVSWVRNGTSDVLFQWEFDNELITPKIADAAAQDFDWGHALIGNAFDHVVGYTIPQAEALLKVYVMFLLFRNMTSARPILTMLGPPGGGKTTLLNRIYRLIYGRRKAVSSIRGPAQFDEDVISNPFVFFDNVDTQAAWLPDSLALSAGHTDLTARKLYTDTDKVRRKRQALVGVSAHNPRFARADVVDRMLMYQFERRTHFGSEKEILHDIDVARDLCWGAIVRDVQKVLAVNPATLPPAPNFRVQDFATIGWWIAHGLGVAEPFGEAIALNVRDQRKFVLEEETTLLSALGALVRGRARRNGHIEHWESSHALWSQLETLSGEPMVFRRSYPDAPSLGRKLHNLEHMISDLFVITSKVEPDGMRVWNVTGKGKVP